ncbi:glycosyltransferase [Aquincola tertiaricarbonis]|uniref:glycosyltransferase n=1 Tax=Aquincola tertiaricarbonis TaxID=391953 RepID=UPI000615071F|nr:glycosyltransferase [Aquincola tertiaricarbonis]
MQLALLCPPYPGHLNPMFALGDALRRRGHAVSFIGIADTGEAVTRAGFGFEAVGADSSHPPGTLARMEARLAGLRGLLGIGGVIDDVAAMTDMLCREAPAVIERLQPGAIVCDQLEPAGGLLARRYRLPQVSVANALMLDREPYVPPPFTDWPYARTTWARERNLGGYRVSDWMMARVATVLERWSRDYGLAPCQRTEHCLSDRQIGQLSPALDFPRESLGDGFHYTGPLRQPLDDEPAWQPPPGARGPFAFVSLGSLQGGRFGLIARLTRACRDVGLTAIVAHNGRLDAAQVARLPGDPVVARYLPQRQVIRHCALVVSHGGMNTVLDALDAGVPLALLPLAMEQGAITQRVLRAGAGRRLSGLRSVPALRRLVTGVLSDGRHRQRAAELGASLQAGGGAARAAELVEHHAH